MLKKSLLVCLTLTTLFSSACNNEQQKDGKNLAKEKVALNTEKLDTATFGAGCFWCVETIFLELKGVEKVESGYSGGKIANPTYKQVCTGTTGHAEAVRILFDPKQITYKELLEAFWQTHDPTTLNQQGADVGTQYRSVIFYHSPQQKEEAEYYKNELDKTGAFKGPIVTEITPSVVFYKAEDYHQDYYNQNENQGYCQYVIKPKLEKFKKAFASKLK